MRMPRFRFRLRTLLIVVAAAAIVLEIEVLLARVAIGAVSETGDEGMVYQKGEAVLAWSGLQVVFVPLVGLVGMMLRDALQPTDTSR